MTKNIKISLDCMGGDKAPQIVVEGANIAASKRSDIFFNFFGDKDKIENIARNCRHLQNRYKIFHTNESISPEEKPSVALRRGKKSSMRLAIDSVKNKESDVVISAGNTGALMAMSKIVLRPLESINRPAIITAIPNKKGTATALLDMGANVECSPDVLLQFAIMGHAFAKVALKIENPTIGLLNIGSEDEKGHEELKIAANLLRNSDLNSSFYGYVEGDDITKGTVDVVVTDGFTGNIALKSIEGSAKLVSQIIKNGFSSSFAAKIGYLFAASAIKRAAKSIDPRMHNGAMLIGLNGISVKSHGSTDAIGFASAIKVAISLVTKDINNQILEELKTAEESISKANISISSEKIEE